LKDPPTFIASQAHLWAQTKDVKKISKRTQKVQRPELEHESSKWEFKVVQIARCTLNIMWM
jgi:hypothetical protein